MTSRWELQKNDAIKMRTSGHSIREIESALGIPRSTLSVWLRNIGISARHKKSLDRRAKAALVHARIEAVKWHNAQKAGRMREAEEAAKKTLAKIKMPDDAVVELALALLYLGEGIKKSSRTAMGNADPMILKFFVAALHQLYKVPFDDMKCELHLRADQKPGDMVDYWSHILGIPKHNFGKPFIDQRTAGRTTYPHYKGVCVVRCARVAIQRKLGYIAATFCNQMAENCAVSSVG